MEEQDGLAALLLELKDRSGLSYGVLARRLHLSTSTLHRYCNGETVPLEYAPLERFAKLCKVTPDELTELHRRWVVAGEQRVRREQQPAVVRVPPVEAAPLPEPEPERAPEAGPSPVRPRWRRHPVLLAGLALAVLVPLTVAYQMGDAHQPWESPLPSQPTRQEAVASGGGASSSSSAVPAPLTVTVTPYTLCGRDILVDRPPNQVPPTVDLQDTPAWVSALDGITTRNHEMSVMVQGTDDRTVVLEALHVRTVSSQAPPTTGNVYELGTGCGGPVDTTIFDVDLDQPHPDPKSPSKHHLPLKVSENDPEELQVAAQALTHDVSWYLELDWSSGRRHGTLRIDDHGKPFRTTGADDRPHYWFDYDNRQWAPEP
ncbi:helix-turn-helix transcriptional regulator [Kineosporia sp. NBRC 101731]|uniref:helix-turn-helix domain-containing protein n=1 Tax=Kineosporia sp. NBRC 101731 TaxID=3032199 RepID=UPI0024A3278C|nr:helix-turn-helix transcriptional regulator [Kineosporia sp. NBRC 101731]GLY28153.1 hypothetical protein Kisp02_15180 [Kineosporia sp. NBRC 101731]